LRKGGKKIQGKRVEGGRRERSFIGTCFSGEKRNPVRQAKEEKEAERGGGKTDLQKTPISYT